MIVRREFDISHYHQPRAALVCNLLLVLCACSATSSFFWHRLGSPANWRRIPCTIWLALIIYLDSFLFVVGSAVLQFAYKPDQSLAVCQAAILLCIVAYLGTKLFIYLFLVERAFVIRRTPKTRLKSKWYRCHLAFVLAINLTFLALLLGYRIYFIDNKLCMVSVQHDVLICIIIFDVLINVYLTTLFLRPVLLSYSLQRPDFAIGKMPWSTTEISNPVDAQLRRLALRTFLGTLCTLLSSLANLIGQTVFEGQPFWLCLLCCEADILFSAIVIHCITNNKHLHTSLPRSQGGGFDIELANSGGSGGTMESSMRSQATSDRCGSIPVTLVASRPPKPAALMDSLSK